MFYPSDNVDVPFYFAWGNNPARTKISISIDCDIRHKIDECLRIVLNKYTTEELKKQEESSPFLYLYARLEDKEPFSKFSLSRVVSVS